MTRSSGKALLNRIASFPFFIPLLGLYPVLFLLSQNMGQISPEASLRSIAISITIALILSGACLLLVRPASRAYLAAGVVNLAFFSYGHLFNLLDGRQINGFLFGRHSLFFPVYAVLFLALLLFVLKKASPKSSPAPVFNFLLICLSLFQLVPVLSYQLSGSNPQGSDQIAGVSAGPAVDNAAETAAADSPSPDIYYIVIDGLLREDVMRGEMGYTDYSLPEDLEQRGFIIPECAFSNYPATALSITSSLNFDYVSALGVSDELVNTSKKNDPPELYNLLHQNRVVSYLKQRGYAFVSFRGFFPLNDFQEADYYYNVNENEQGQDDLAERSFYEMFIRTSLLRLPSEMLTGMPQLADRFPRAVVEWIAPDASVFSSRSYQWYRQHLYSFEKLAAVPTLPGKKFVYAHFYTTHQPYVFQPDGRLQWPVNENNDGYIAAAKYTSRRILEVIDQILETSPEPPVIIVQADHGIGDGLNIHKILNAYYLPGGGHELYPTITPVNTFRMVLNRYADGNFEILPDIIMRSEEENAPFRQIPVSCDLQ